MVDQVIFGPKVYTELGVLQNTEVVIRNGSIQRILKKDTHTPKPTLRFPETYHLVPGFIDCHVHGANGYDVMDGTITALSEISQALTREGTTSYLATTMTVSEEVLEKTLQAIQEYRAQQNEGATI